MRPLLFFILAAAASAENGWDYIRLGSPHNVSTPTQGGILFAGGGADLDDAFRWMCAKANGGDFLVLRASGTDAYNPTSAESVPPSTPSPRSSSPAAWAPNSPSSKTPS
jgi:cyanophycinase